jgi:lysophospholipase L1-like esterase
MKKKPAILVAIALLVAVMLLGLYALNQHSPTARVKTAGARIQSQIVSRLPGPTTSAGPVISRNAPAFASSANDPAAYANSGNYDQSWRSQGSPAWLAYDLSKVNVSERQKVLVVWYNQTLAYDHTIINEYAYNLPHDYTLEVSNAPGGGKPPDYGWKTLVTVKGNHYHSRQHLLELGGNNWLRIDVTAVDGAPENFDVALKMDVYNANSATSDDWIFFGDSITAGGMGHWTTVNGVKTFAELIGEQATDYFPVQESGGIGYLTSADGVKYLASWLKLFPGKYVGLSYGTNDAIGCVSPDSFYNQYVTMVQDVLSYGKIPVIPHIPWGKHPNIQRCGPGLNAKIDALYSAYPQIIKGPDLWALFQHNPQLISSDSIHPTATGFGIYRQQWAHAMYEEVYKNAAG